MPVMLRGYFDIDLWKIFIELNYFYRQIYAKQVTVCNKARVEGCIAEAFTRKDITNFSSKYFSHANNVNAHTIT
jgi:hypothetical protein